MPEYIVLNPQDSSYGETVFCPYCHVELVIWGESNEDLAEHIIECGKCHEKFYIKVEVTYTTKKIQL